MYFRDKLKTFAYLSKKKKVTLTQDRPVGKLGVQTQDFQVGSQALQTTCPLIYLFVSVRAANITIWVTSASARAGKSLSRQFGQIHFRQRQLGYCSFNCIWSSFRDKYRLVLLAGIQLSVKTNLKVTTFVIGQLKP